MTLNFSPHSALGRKPDVAGASVSGQWQPIRKLRRVFNFWHWAFVIFPVTAAAVFFFGIAADQYMSVASFVVRTQASTQATSVLGDFLQSAGVSHATEDTFAVNNFMQSRDAVRLLEQKAELRAIFGRPEADFVTRFPNVFVNSSFERLYEHYLGAVEVHRDGTTGVTTLQVKAYRPEDAQGIAQALLTYSEELVNRLNARAEENALSAARRQVREAEIQLERIQAARAQLGRSQGARTSSFVEFDRLALQRDLAQQSLASATRSLEVSRMEAQRQHLYIVRISEPNQPDYPLYPKRLLGFLLTAITCFVAYGIIWLLVTGVREHGSS